MSEYKSEISCLTPVSQLDALKCLVQSSRLCTLFI